MRPTSRPCWRSHRSDQDGFVMSAAIVFILVGLMLFAAAYHRFASVLRLEERRVDLNPRASISGPVLAKGLDLLKTGTPPKTPYSCRVVVIRAGKSIDRSVRIERRGGKFWLVADMPARRRSGDCPRSFAREASR